MCRFVFVCNLCCRRLYAFICVLDPQPSPPSHHLNRICLGAACRTCPAPKTMERASTTYHLLPLQYSVSQTQMQNFDHKQEPGTCTHAKPGSMEGFFCNLVLDQSFDTCVQPSSSPHLVAFSLNSVLNVSCLLPPFSFDIFIFWLRLRTSAVVFTLRVKPVPAWTDRAALSTNCLEFMMIYCLCAQVS